MMTEILLSVTTEEMENIAKEVYNKAKAKGDLPYEHNILKGQG